MQNKGVILSVLALVLVVGAPAAIAWADADESVSLTETGIAADMPTIRDDIQYWVDGVKYNVVATSSDTAGAVDNMLFHLAEFGNLGLTLLSTATMMGTITSAAAFNVDVGVSTEGAGIESLKAVFYKADGAVWNKILVVDLTDGPHVLTALERLILQEATNLNFEVLFSTAVGSDFMLSFQPHVFAASELIDDGVVGMIMTAAGILLIVCAVYATPWVRVGSATAMAERAYAAGKRAAVRAMKSAEARRAAKRRDRR